MRLQLAALATLLIAGCTSGAPTGPADQDHVPGPAPTETGTRWITMDVDALETARATLELRSPGKQLHVLETVGDVAIVQFDAEDLPALSSNMHASHNRCGGFMLHDSMDEAFGALDAKEAEGLAPLVTYTIDNAATVNALLPALSQSTLLGTIQHLSSYTTRYYTSATGAAASTWLRDLWSGYAASRPDVTVQLFETGWAQKSVIATIPGSTLASEVVVIGGHLDSISSGSTAPGADDDASGIATLTEVFRVLMAQDFRPLRTLKFMAYAAEEVGLRGSQQIASQHKTQGINVVGVMQLDMTNYKGSTGDIYLMQDYTNAAQNTFVASLIDTYLPGVVRGTDSCGYGCSDHASWHNQGFATSMPFESRMSQYNPTIHTTGDTLSVSGNNANHAIKFARLATTYAAELAKGTLGTSGNTPPSVSISAPANGSSHASTSPISLAGSATDAQDGTISGSIRWSSNIDGSLGTGATRSVTLTAGAHTIRAEVTDSGGLTSSAQISITVTGAPGAELLRENFESGTSWAPSGLWHVVNNTACVSPAYTSATRAMYFGIDGTCNYSNGTRVQGTITSPAISGVLSTSRLNFKNWRVVESDSGSYDVASVEVVVGAAATTVWSRSSANPSTPGWTDSGNISLAAYAGQTIQLRFRFDSKDASYNTFTGWLIDDVVVTR